MQQEKTAPHQTPNTAQRTADRGLYIFALIWFGQLISILGSGLSGFALSTWVYETSESVTRYGLVILSTMLPNILLSPLAGALVDRWDRRKVMILSDVGAGLGTLAIALLFLSGQFELWHICLAVAASSAFSAFQWPAYSASTPLLVPQEHLGRANGMTQLGQAIGYIFSPVLAGFLVLTIQVQGVILIDFVTFLFAVLTLLFIRIPSPKPTTEGEAGKGSLLREAAYGLTYLAARPGLLSMLILFAVLNFLMGFVNTLVTPLILSFTTTDVLGSMLSIGSSGMLFGGILMSIWGGPKRRIHGVLGFLLLTGVFILVAGLRPSVPLITAAAWSFFFCTPFVGGSSEAIWQSKVAPDMQGRASATRSMIAQMAAPVAMVLAGPLADHVFEPLLAVEGPLAGSVGRLIGVGPGRGIGLIFIVVGILTTLVTIGGCLYPRLRLVEDELPDVLADETPTAPNEQGDRYDDQRLPAPIVSGESLVP